MKMKLSTRCRSGLFALSAILLAAIAGAPGLAEAGATKIRIAFPSGMNGQIIVTMREAGIAAKHDLDAEFLSFQYGPPMMEALASGNVDAVVTSLMPITSFASKAPGKIKVVAALGNSSHSLMVAQDSPIKALSDLKGKQLAVSFGSDSHLDTLVTLTKAGIDPKADAKLLNVRPNELVLTLEKKFADAIVIRQPQVLRLQEQFNARIVHTWPFRFVTIVRSDYMKENPDAREKYVAALRESVFYIATHKEQAAKWFGAHLRIDPVIVQKVSNDDPNYNIKSMEEVQVELTPAVKTILTDWVVAAHKFGMIKTSVDPQVLFP